MTGRESELDHKMCAPAPGDHGLGDFTSAESRHQHVAPSSHAAKHRTARSAPPGTLRFDTPTILEPKDEGVDASGTGGDYQPIRRKQGLAWPRSGGQFLSRCWWLT